MRIVETRVLEGPNIFLLEPAIKIELAADDGELSADDLKQVDRLAALLVEASLKSGQKAPRVVIEALESPGHIAIAYSWTHRRFAVALAELIVASIEGDADIEAFTFRVVDVLAESHRDDSPGMIADSVRDKLTIGVTGTNGKTTTTRLIAHLFQNAGKHVGWSCSSGVYIDGEEVLSGDYSGPRGAQRVLEDAGVEVGVVELARGGILLRGIACQSLDVSVFTNISADHLDLQGIHTVEGLAKAKSVVSRVTRADGHAVVNCSDPLVMKFTEGIAAKRMLFGSDAIEPVLKAHIAAGGTALVQEAQAFVLYCDEDRTELTTVDQVPMTYAGAAGFMVENALAGAAAGLMGGLSPEEVRAGLASFDNSSDKNPGRLNVYELDGVTIVLDFAHNEAGLQALLDFARSLIGASGEIYAVVGTAGDRTDESLRELGRIASISADHIVAKDTQKYLRGRDAADLMALYAAGAQSGGDASYEEAADELAAVNRALSLAKSGDAVAIMSHESASEIVQQVIERGGKPRS